MTVGVTAIGPRARALSIASWSGLLALLCLFASPVRADAVDDFWYWFEFEHEALLAPETRADREDALTYWLGRIDPGLSYVLDTKKYNVATILTLLTGQALVLGSLCILVATMGVILKTLIAPWLLSA